MKVYNLTFFLFCISMTAFSQKIKQRDDTLSIEYSANKQKLKFKKLPYYELDGFQQYRPFERNRLPIARSGNMGLPTHSYVALKQDWDINHLMGGYQNYLMTVDSLRFYRMSRPFTELKYTNGAEKEQIFNVLHAQNLGKGLNISFEYQKTVSEGFFIQQLVNHTQFNATYNLESRSKRFRSKGFFIINDLESQENGGVVLSDNDIPDDNTALLDINLRDAQNRGRTQSIGFHNSYSLWQKSEKHSILDFSHEVEWGKSFRNYSNDLTNSPDFYNQFFTDSTLTADSSYAQVLSNTLKLNFFNDQFSIGYKDEQYHYFQNYLLEEDFESSFLVTYFDIALFNQEFKTTIEKGISGFHEEEVDIMSQLDLKEWKGIKNQFLVSVTQKQADYFLMNQRTNHDLFRKEFETSQQSLFQYKISIDTIQLFLKVGFQNFENYIYFDTTQSPQQFSASISNLYIELFKRFDFAKHWVFLNRIRYQQLSNDEIIPLPELYSYHSLFYENIFFKESLKIQIGVDFYYIGDYKGYSYAPSLAQFHLNSNESGLGEINQLDIFLNMSINKSGRIFVKMENVLSESFSEDTYRIQNYPIPGRALKVGFSWRMVN